MVVNFCFNFEVSHAPDEIAFFAAVGAAGAVLAFQVPALRFVKVIMGLL